MSEDESIVIPARNYADIAKLSNPTAAEEFLLSSRTSIVETITGAIQNGPKHFLVIVGHLVQAALKGKMLDQWAREIKKLREDGAIPEDFAEKKYGFQTWAELISIIDEDRPDADRLEALKAMFLAVNKINSTDAEQMLAYQLWLIAKQLNSGELLVLKAAYENRILFATAGRWDFGSWVGYMANKLGHHMSSLVSVHVKKLVELNLISQADSVNRPPDNARLTDLGLRFCQNIETYELKIKET